MSAALCAVFGIAIGWWLRGYLDRILFKVAWRLVVTGIGKRKLAEKLASVIAELDEEPHP